MSHAQFLGVIHNYASAYCYAGPKLTFKKPWLTLHSSIIKLDRRPSMAVYTLPVSTTWEYGERYCFFWHTTQTTVEQKKIVQSKVVNNGSFLGQELWQRTHTTPWPSSKSNNHGKSPFTMGQSQSYCARQSCYNLCRLSVSVLLTISQTTPTTCTFHCNKKILFDKMNFDL